MTTIVETRFLTNGSSLLISLKPGKDLKWTYENTVLIKLKASLFSFTSGKLNKSHLSKGYESENIREIKKNKCYSLHAQKQDKNSFEEGRSTDS